MKKEAAKAIVEAAVSIGKEVTLYEDYSGRGMYGKKTDGVVGSISDIIVCIAKAASEFTTIAEAHDRDGLDIPPFSIDDFIEGLNRLSFDNMGRYDMIAY